MDSELVQVLWSLLTNPNVVYALLIVGLWATAAAFYVPGTGLRRSRQSWRRRWARWWRWCWEQVQSELWTAISARAKKWRLCPGRASGMCDAHGFSSTKEAVKWNGS